MQYLRLLVEELASSPLNDLFEARVQRRDTFALAKKVCKETSANKKSRHKPADIYGVDYSISISIKNHQVKPPWTVVQLVFLPS